MSIKSLFMGCDFSHQPICPECLDLINYGEKCPMHGGFEVKWKSAKGGYCYNCNKTCYCSEFDRRLCNQQCAKWFVESRRCWKCLTPRLTGLIQSCTWCKKCRRDTKTATREELMTAVGIYHCQNCWNLHIERMYGGRACGYPCEVKIQNSIELRKQCRECDRRSESPFEYGICASCEIDLKVNGCREDCAKCRRRKPIKDMIYVKNDGREYRFCSDECRRVSEHRCSICNETFVHFGSAEVCSDKNCREIFDAQKIVVGISGVISVPPEFDGTKIKLYAKTCSSCNMTFLVDSGRIRRDCCFRRSCYIERRILPNFEDYKMMKIIWIKECMRESGEFIQYTGVTYTFEDGTVYKIDGYCAKTNTIYEFRHNENYVMAQKFMNLGFKVVVSPKF